MAEWPPVTRVIVGAAVIEGGKLLAAERAYPAELAGLWELPGGKVEPGESEQEALIRECREELGIEIRLGERVGGDWPLGEQRVMRVWAASITEGEPTPHEHSKLRWLAKEELHDVPWLPGDLPILPELAHLL
jgi:8-oxo-dGTP diphosphatase